MEHGAWGPANNEYKGTKKRLRQKNPAVQVETRDSHLCHNRLSLPSLFTPHPINHVCRPSGVTVHFVAAYSAVLWPHQVGPDEGEGEGAGEPARRRKGVSFSCVRPRPLAESRRRPLTAWAFKGRGKKYIFTVTAFHAYNSDIVRCSQRGTH